MSILLNMKGGPRPQNIKNHQNVFVRKDETGEIIITAKTRPLGIGGYAFETSFLGHPYELNINMPTFPTIAKTEKWILRQRGWTKENK